MLDNFNKNRLIRRGIIILYIHRVITIWPLPDLILHIIIIFLRSVYSFKERYQITMEYITFFIEQKMFSHFSEVNNMYTHTKIYTQPIN